LKIQSPSTIKNENHTYEYVLFKHLELFDVQLKSGIKKKYTFIKGLRLTNKVIKNNFLTMELSSNSENYYPFNWGGYQVQYQIHLMPFWEDKKSRFSSKSFLYNHHADKLK